MEPAGFPVVAHAVYVPPTAGEAVNYVAEASHAERKLSRRVGMSSLILPRRRQAEEKSGGTAEETNMRMKLFRLMYETIRDSDLKVKRAELIREHYVNSTRFQIGYLFGDLTDKYNTINDISNTLQRFYKQWNSIEHINAYEQIANQAIEISHLTDMIRVMNKRDQQ